MRPASAASVWLATRCSRKPRPVADARHQTVDARAMHRLVDKDVGAGGEIRKTLDTAPCRPRKTIDRPAASKRKAKLSTTGGWLLACACIVTVPEREPALLQQFQVNHRGEIRPALVSDPGLDVIGHRGEEMPPIRGQARRAVNRHLVLQSGGPRRVDQRAPVPDSDRSADG